MGTRFHLPRFGAAIAALAGAAGLAGSAPALASSVPTGEVATGQSLIEPAYDDSTGALVYLRTPTNVANPVNSNPRSSAPLYLVVYPASAESSVGPLNCEDTPVENCGDHGPKIAGLAAGVVPAVYGSGVFGHDHLVGVANTGGDFNIAWDVKVVLFTSSAAAKNHLTTLEAVNAAIANHQAFIFPGPITTFHCSVVPAAAYDKGTPVTG